MPSLLLRLLLLLTATLTLASASAVGTQRDITIYTWPTSAKKQSKLADITYTVGSSNGTLKSYTPPTGLQDADLVRVLIQPPGGEWSGSVTSFASFKAEYKKAIVLHVDDEGVVYHVGFRAGGRAITSGKVQGRGGTTDLVVEVVMPKVGPKTSFNKPVVLDETTGEVTKEEPQKTFLQKYWWAIAIFLVVQLASAGGAEEGK